MPLIPLSFDVNDSQQIARFANLPPNLVKALIARLTPVKTNMLGRVQAVVPRRTGKLLSEIQGFLDSGPDWVRVRVKVVVDRNAGSGPRGNRDAGKAAALEYGASNLAQVKAFQRRRGEDVRAYQRRVNITARRFLRGPFEATKPEATAAVGQAVTDVTG